MDTIGAAYPNNSNIIHITSEGYKNEIVIDLLDLKSLSMNGNTEGLLAGMCEGIKKYGFCVSGFDAYISTNVIPAAGVSSSASFEMLICSIVNYFFNNNCMTYTDYAKIGKYAENEYWHKDSGMMDQMACAVGGTVLFDFSSNEPCYHKMNFSFNDFGYQLVIVNTGKGHANLSEEYSEIPMEMKQVAAILGVNLLHESTLESLLFHLKYIENDRSILRAIHFFEENERVQRCVELIKKEDINGIINLINQSGNSSWKLLQNCYSIQNFQEQKITLALTLTEIFLQKIKSGVCRVHGGGFAGVIMCIIPNKEKDNYINYISKFVGKENVYPMNIREIGAVHISSR